MTCLTPDDFIELLESRRLDAPAPEEARHFQQCAVCRDAWASIGAADEVLPRLRPARRRTLPWMTSAAAVLLLGTLGFLLFRGVGISSPGREAQEFESSLHRLLPLLKDESPQVREQAEADLEGLVRKSGRSALLRLRAEEKREADPETRARIADILHRLTAPKQLWRVPIGHVTMGCVAPAVGAGVAVFPIEGQFVGLDAETGAIRWRLPGDSRAHAVVAGNTVLAACPRGPEVGIQALNPASGERYWHQGFADLWGEPKPSDQSLYNDSSFFISGNRLWSGSRSGRVVCVDAATGRRLWTSPELQGREPARKADVFNPVQHDQRVFAVSWGHSLVALDAQTGALAWSAPAPGIGALTPVVDGERLYVATHELAANQEDRGACIAFSAKDGSRLWETDLKDYGHGALGLIGIGDVLVAHGRTALVGLRKRDGAILWSVPCRRFGYSTLATDARGRVYAASERHELIVVAPLTGRTLLRLDLRESPPARVRQVKVEREDDRSLFDGKPYITGCPAVLGDTVYLLTPAGDALALRLSSLMEED
ncbi:MAG TPA: PQQ-binding-like beta-propeller repeat protein [Planctomycetota bacterium]|nr:PQQ-binding-like beta-propeller repeat protein [Planctomycetota bacterium]